MLRPNLLVFAVPFDDPLLLFFIFCSLSMNLAHCPQTPKWPHLSKSKVAGRPKQTMHSGEFFSVGIVSLKPAGIFKRLSAEPVASDFDPIPDTSDTVLPEFSPHQKSKL